jgi:prepilin-type N-terminal cleavage/methylation domain-containing protein
MKTNNKGFTLIELIMVIVILGILAAVAVPKFFDLTSQAHLKNKAAVLGNIKAGLQLYAANQLVTTGSRAFPAGGDIDDDGDFSAILDEEPEGWTTAQGTADDDTCYFVYQTGTANHHTYAYFSAGGGSYTITDYQAD